MLCRSVYHAALGERRDAYRMRGISFTYYQQRAELPGINQALLLLGSIYDEGHDAGVSSAPRRRERVLGEVARLLAILHESPQEGIERLLVAFHLHSTRVR
jgi:hypothetical protein